MQTSVISYALWGLLLGGVALAQSRDSEPASTYPIVVVDGELAAASFDPRIAAQLLLEEWDLVALGEFVRLSDVDSDGQDALSPRLVTPSFRLLHVYKGVATEGSSIRIALNSDMLAYPGDTVSRYAKRLDLRERQQTLGTSSRRVFVSHGATFYDRGAITEGQRYLVGLEAISTSEGTYALDDLSTNRNILWGELADDVGGALTTLTR